MNVTDDCCAKIEVTVVNEKLNDLNRELERLHEEIRLLDDKLESVSVSNPTCPPCEKDKLGQPLCKLAQSISGYTYKIMDLTDKVCSMRSNLQI